MAPTPIPASERFWSKVDKRGEAECWPWRAATSPKGYGSFQVGCGNKQRANRVAWMLTVGPIPRGYHVLHRCDNPCCVNPNHLFLGTAADNIADMIAKKRHYHGVRHWKRKLSDEDVASIRASTETQTVIAERFGIRQGTVSSIRRSRERHL